MSLAQAPPSDRGASPLMSNNPFRNRLASNAPAPVRPVSTNPFLDINETTKDEPILTVTPSPDNVVNSTADLFVSMNVNEQQNSSQRSPGPRHNGVMHRADNTPLRPDRGPPPRGHRPARSGDERRDPQINGASNELDIFADPVDLKSRLTERERAPRRNSESSIMDKTGMLDGDEEKSRRDRRHRDSKRAGTARTKPSKKLDVIDKLDVTSIYGTGLFHHDGPFDACNPHRNRRKHKLAPMQAFPKDSENMKIGGSGPVNEKLDYNKFHGFGQEAHIDFNEAGQEQGVVDDDAAYFSRQLDVKPQSFSATARVDQVHGRETAGLGTSTFLEGAPASRIAIQRRDSEYEQQQALQQGQNGGLSRKKSFAQKIRAVRPGGSGRVQSPDQERPPPSPLSNGRSEAGANAGANPFFREYDTEKGAQIALTEEQTKSGRTRAPSSPRRGTGLERSITAGSTDASAPESKPTGLLGRMKSLKKSRRTDR